MAWLHRSHPFNCNWVAMIYRFMDHHGLSMKQQQRQYWTIIINNTIINNCELITIIIIIIIIKSIYAPTRKFISSEPFVIAACCLALYWFMKFMDKSLTYLLYTLTSNLDDPKSEQLFIRANHLLFDNWLIGTNKANECNLWLSFAIIAFG